jgi:chromosome segregation ATPase
LQSLTANVTVLGNRLSAIESQNAVADRDRKDLAATVQQLQSLREKYGTVDELKKQFDGDHKELLTIVAAQQLLREKDAALERKLNEAELERKDLLKEVQGLRERIAKLEGQSQPNSGGKQAAESGR